MGVFTGSDSAEASEEAIHFGGGFSEKGKSTRLVGLDARFPETLKPFGERVVCRCEQRRRRAFGVRTQRSDSADGVGSGACRPWGVFDEKDDQPAAGIAAAERVVSHFACGVEPAQGIAVGAHDEPGFSDRGEEQVRA